MSDTMLAMLFSLAVAFVVAFYFLVGEIADVARGARPRRARTCGTCAYCEQENRMHPDGYCCRHAYQRNPMCVNDGAVRHIVQLNWRGCGESEERT